MKFRTEQEDFWAGEFGSEYIKRNQGDDLLASNLALFSRVLGRTHEIKTCIEFGANIGMNIRALGLLRPNIDIHAIEINKDAVKHLETLIGRLNIYNSSILDFNTSQQWDLTIIKGVLIHINPDELVDTYRKLFNSTRRYLLLAEYYNPVPMTVAYRGHDNRLFKRDFAGEIMDIYPELKLIDYGFSYHRDPAFPQDDLTWFLMEKN